MNFLGAYMSLSFKSFFFLTADHCLWKIFTLVNKFEPILNAETSLLQTLT
jgi:hypothetical protein